MRRLPKFGTAAAMLDNFDRQLLDCVQFDGSRTADSLSAEVPLSPSAIARRLRRLRSQGWIRRTIALVSRKLTERRLRAIVLLQLSEHADQRGKTELLTRIEDSPHVQFCYELAGVYDLVLLFDCAHMDEFNEVAEAVLVADPTVRRFETSFVKREAKFAPFVKLTETDPEG